ncbi:hypothetical protein P7K49_016726, partial [Saguinus oedipus]
VAHGAVPAHLATGCRGAQGIHHRIAPHCLPPLRGTRLSSRDISEPTLALLLTSPGPGSCRLQ